MPAEDDLCHHIVEELECLDDLMIDIEVKIRNRRPRSSVAVKGGYFRHTL